MFRRVINFHFLYLYRQPYLHVYQAAVNKEKTQKHLLSKMIDSLFGGSPTQLVIQALGNGEHKASPEELEEIQAILNQLKNQ